MDTDNAPDAAKTPILRNQMAQTMMSVEEKRNMQVLSRVLEITVSQLLRELVAEKFEQETKRIARWLKAGGTLDNTGPTLLEKKALRDEIVDRFNAGDSAIVLADEFGYTRSAIYAMVKRAKPAPVTPEEMEKWERRMEANVARMKRETGERVDAKPEPKQRGTYIGTQTEATAAPPTPNPQQRMTELPKLKNNPFGDEKTPAERLKEMFPDG